MSQTCCRIQNNTLQEVTPENRYPMKKCHSSTMKNVTHPHRVHFVDLHRCDFSISNTWHERKSIRETVHKHHVALPTQAQTHGILRALHPFSILQLNRDAAVEVNLRYTPVSIGGQGLIRVRVRVGAKRVLTVNRHCLDGCPVG